MGEEGKGDILIFGARELSGDTIPLVIGGHNTISQPLPDVAGWIALDLRQGY
jgi:hypothetical protein